MIKYCVLLFLALSFVSCNNSKQEKLISLLKEWEQREVLFPDNPIFTIQGRDTFNFFLEENFKIVSYMDSAGCTFCKLRLRGWNQFISYLDTCSHSRIPIFFFFHPKDKAQIEDILMHENFKYPVCIDVNDSFNKLNHFPSDIAFQTFLLDKSNRIVAIGNPVYNPKVKELYLKIIQGDKVESDNKKNVIQTEASVGKSVISLGHFDWQKEQKASFVLRNIGKSLLVIQDVNTSCGCTEVTYSKEPVRPGDSILLDVSYKAETPGSFNKTITIYCNANSSPIVLRIMGDADGY